jgi:hypothetical protein
MNMLERYHTYVFGTGYMRFGGHGSIHSVVRISENPNDRANPRAKDAKHAADLRASIDKDKHDWQNPIVIGLKRELLSDEMRVKLKACPPFQQFNKPSLLKLKDCTEEEEKIDRALFLEQAEDGRFLTVEDINQMRSRLKELIGARVLAELWNGNHRIEVGLNRSNELLAPVQQNLIKLMRRHFEQKDPAVTPQMIQDASDSLQDELPAHTWQVLVVDSKLLALIPA